MASNPGLRAEFVARDDLLRERESWQALADRAIEPNPFFEPWFLIPALRHLDPSGSVRVLVVRSGSTLVGLCPFVYQRSCKGIPWPVLSVWQHAYCYQCTPLIDAELSDRVLQTLREFTGKVMGWRGILRLPLISQADPFAVRLRAILEPSGTPLYVDPSFSRPYLQQRGHDAEEYLQRVLSNKSRKRLARQEQELSIRGDLEYIQINRDQSLSDWIETFGKLEASGWKGRQGTALIQNQSDWLFFQEFAEEGFRADRFFMNGLRVGGQMIALECNLLSHQIVFGFKTAFNEEFADYSPGVLLEVDIIRQLHRDPRIIAIDSCVAGSGSPLERLYDGRREIATVLVPVGGFIASWFVRALPRLRRVRHWFRRSSFSNSDASTPPRL